MNPCLIAVVLELFGAVAVAPATGPDNREVIRIRIILARAKDDPKADADQLKKLHAKLNELGVKIDQMLVNPGPSRAQVIYHSHLSNKRIIRLVETLLEHGIGNIELSAVGEKFTEKNPPPKPKEQDKTSSKEKEPPAFDQAPFVRLVLIEFGNDERVATFRNLVVARNQEVQLRLAAGKDTFKIEGKDNALLTVKVVQIGPRAIVILVQQTYYHVEIGQTIADALKKPLSKERIEELKLPAPK